ncbi:hypothetical protein BC629DRAFT_947855 [Irpex lacteus]|nr:hypothetical protein BC629DRAFT_947855 [Irpex lacteus]
MPVSLAVWSQILKPGDGVEFVPPADLKLANAALGAEIADEKSRSSLRLIYSGPSAGDSDDDDEEDEDSDDERLAPVATVLCSLTPGKVEQAMLDLVLEGGQAVAFENTGKNTIYITGNFIDQVPHDDPPSDSELGLPGDEDEEIEGDELVDDEEDVPMQEPEPPKAKSKKSKKGVSVPASESAPQTQSQPPKESTSEPKTSKKEKKDKQKDKKSKGKVVS